MNLNKIFQCVFFVSKFVSFVFHLNSMLGKTHEWNENCVFMKMGYRLSQPVNTSTRAVETVF